MAQGALADLVAEYEEAKKAFDPTTVDIPFLLKFAPEVRAELLSQYKNDIMQGVIDRVCTSSEMPAVPIDLSTVAFCEDSLWSHVAAQKTVYTDACFRKVPLEYFLYVAFQKRGRGLHELLFGKPMPVVISQMEETYLEKMMQLPSSIRRLIVTDLQNTQKPQISCGLYIFQDRMAELTAEKNYSDTYLLRMATPFSKKDQITFLNDAARARYAIIAKIDPVHGVDPSYEYIAATWRKFLFLCWRLCAEHNLSADRLFCPDFSSFAVDRDGKPLSEEQKKQLQAFLLCSRETRMKVMARLYLLTAV